MKFVALTAGAVAIVDDADADLALLRWYFHRDNRHGTGYAARNAPEVNGRAGPKEFMHRAIARRMGFGDADQVDHVNGNRLDNRRSNLRPATCAQNARNRAAANRWGLKGVSRRSNGKWQARITVDGYTRSLGHFGTASEAADAYARAAAELHGEYARTR